MDLYTQRRDDSLNNYIKPINKNLDQRRTMGRLSKEKDMPLGGSKNEKTREKTAHLKSKRYVEKMDPNLHFSRPRKTHEGASIPPTFYRKPWPGTKASEDEELVKHMSNIPCYLQHLEQSDGGREKALNFGVIDWGRLEKWAYDQKQVVEGGKGDSPLASNTSSVGTLGAINKSYGGIGSSPALRKKPVPSISHFDPLSKGRQAKTLEDGSTECQQEKCKEKKLDARTLSRSIRGSPDTGSSSLTSKGDETNGSLHRAVKVHGSGESRGEQKPNTHQQQNFCSSLNPPSFLPEDRYSVLSRDIDGMWNNLHESVSGGCSSVESTTLDDQTSRKSCDDFSVNFSPEDAHFTDISARIPYSCPLPSTGVEPQPTSDSLSVTGAATPESNGRHERHKEFIAVNGLARGAKSGTTKARESSPSRRATAAALNWVRRSSSSKEVSLPEGQMKSSNCAENSCENKSTSNNKSRRSPLRRMLDPILKSKDRILTHGPIVSSTIQSTHEPMQVESTSRIGSRKLFPPAINSSSVQGEGNLNSSSELLDKCHDLIQDARHFPSTRQAFLQLTWNDGVPLFMLSSQDCDVLAASMMKRSIPCDNNLECIYTVLSVQDVKKKGSTWMNRSKKQALPSHIIGQLKVSCPESNTDESMGYSAVREFVLFGSEPKPEAHGPLGPNITSELAAIIVKSPIVSSRTGQKSECLSESRITTILPKGVHGFSETGKPSPLIERWKSGGICDCGGWDEGCKLTTLTDKAQEGKCQIELFVQGGIGGDRHALRVVECKEGLYVVELDASITLLQGLAICVAIMHGGKPTDDLGGVGESREANSFQDHIFADNMKRDHRKGAPVRYVSYHPPLSPVGRA